MISRCALTCTLVAALHLCGIAHAQFPPATPPTTWKAINYAPRYHAFDRMLYDWNSVDVTTGQLVSTMVDADLTTLSANGFNVIHLYIWDRTSRNSLNPLKPEGFCSSTADNAVCAGNGLDPRNSPNMQWSNLEAFLTMAQNKNLWVMLDFVNFQVTDAIRTGTACTSIANDYKNWMKIFVDNLQPSHPNIIAWGLNWAWVPDNQYTCTNSVWVDSYQYLKTESAAMFPSRPLQAIVGVGLTFAPVDTATSAYPSDIISHGSGYTYNWNWAPMGAPLMGAQQMAQNIYSLLSADPDFYILGGYNANIKDLQGALANLAATPPVTVPQTRRAIPPSKIFFGEFGISSSLTETASTSRPGLPAGWYGYASIEDQQVPVTSRAGQAQWIANTVCAFQAASVTKYAYWTLYDPFSYWDNWTQPQPWVALQSFWGLKSEDTGSSKSAWSTLSSFYSGGTSCLGSPTYSTAPPVLEVHTDTTYITEAQPIGFYWTVTDMSPNSGASLALNQTYSGGSRSCRTGTTIAGSSLDGSCSFTIADPYYTTGSKSLTMTAYNGSPGVVTPVSQSATFTVGSAPVISTITNGSYGSYITTTDILITWGDGFAIHGGNTVQLHNNTTNVDYWFYEGFGGYYWDNSYNQINAGLGGAVPAGSYTVYVRNGFTGNPSNGFSITIH